MSKYSNSSIDIIQLSTKIATNPMPTFTKLSPHYPTYVLIRHLIITMLLIIAISLAYVMLNLTFLVFPVTGLLLSSIGIWTYYGAKVCQYVVREQDILYQRGIWSQKTTAVAFNRIQHVDISHDPLERYFSTSTLKLFTAGSNYSDLSITGLDKQLAINIRQHILEQSNRGITLKENKPKPNHHLLQSDHHDQ